MKHNTARTLTFKLGYLRLVCYTGPMQHNPSSNYPGSFHHSGQLNANFGLKLQSHWEKLMCRAWVHGYRGRKGVRRRNLLLLTTVGGCLVKTPVLGTCSRDGMFASVSMSSMTVAGGLGLPSAVALMEIPVLLLEVSFLLWKLK